MKKIGFAVEYVILVVLILVFWEFMNIQGQLNTVTLPSPDRVWNTFISLVSRGVLWKDICISFIRVIRGYVLSVIAGITCGVIIGLFVHAKRITNLFIQVIRPIPPIAWIPLVILWFGIGEEGKTFLIFMAGFFTILTNVVDGISSMDGKLVEVSRITETPLYKHVFLTVLPAAAPSIFTGLRLGISSCWMCVVAAELVSASNGLGFLIMNARQFGQTDVVIVGMLTIGVMGKLLDSALKIVEGKLVTWI